MKNFKDKIGIYIKLFLFTLLSILIRGYEYGGGNQVHYFNFALYKFYPGIYAEDYLFKIHNIPYTIFVEFILKVFRFFGENPFLIFVIYFLFLFYFYLAIFSISQKLLKSYSLSFVILLFFIYPIPIAGTTINTVEKMLIPRFMADVFLLWSVYLLLAKKDILSAVVAGVGFLFHPLTVIPYMPVFFLTKYFEKNTGISSNKLFNFVKMSWREIVRQIILFSVVAGPVLFKFIYNSKGESFFIDSEWRHVISERLPYIFIWRWSPIDFVLIVVICAFFQSYKNIFDKPVAAIIKATITVSITLFLISLFSALFNFRMGLQMQLARNLYLFIVFSIVYGGGSLLANVSESKLKKVALVTILIATALCLPARNKYGLLWKNPLSDYQKAAVWAKDNTGREEIFLVPLQAEAFRFWSKRSVFVENKEGGDALYDRNLAMEWDAREDLIEDSELTNPEYLGILRTNYGVDYIITDRELSEPVVYKNDKWFIYKI